MTTPVFAETLAAIMAASEALARASSSNPRPLVPATQPCPACGALRQIASPAPAPAPCRACAAATPTTLEAA